MAFNAYIFEEDFVKLTREFLHASQQQKGGSLFGQWTSTGNPVIHFAMSCYASQSDRDKMRKDLDDKFRICYIGEWRPVQAHVGSDHQEMRARGELWKEGTEGMPSRFLILHVSRTDIVPFLFERQTPKGGGRLERLPGKNPFNNREVYLPSQPRTTNNNPQRYTGYSQQAGPVAVAVHGQGPARSVPHVYQEAITTKPQWYASDEGGRKFQKVLEDFKKIAQRDNVEISRDTRTENISLSFTDKRRGRKWEVQFPPNFPGGGALLIEKQGTARVKEYPQDGSDLARTVVNNIKKYMV